MVQFFQTVMGQRFIEGTVPMLVKALEKQAAAASRLADAMEENNRLLRAGKAPTPGEGGPLNDVAPVVEPEAGPF